MKLRIDGAATSVQAALVVRSPGSSVVVARIPLGEIATGRLTEFRISGAVWDMVPVGRYVIEPTATDGQGRSLLTAPSLVLDVDEVGEV